MDNSLLTYKEREAVELVGQAASLIFEIITENGGLANDADEIAQACHIMQRFVLSNAAARAYPGEYRMLGALSCGPKPEVKLEDYCVGAELEYQAIHGEGQVPSAQLNADGMETT